MSIYAPSLDPSENSRLAFHFGPQLPYRSHDVAADQGTGPVYGAPAPGWARACSCTTCSICGWRGDSRPCRSSAGAAVDDRRHDGRVTDSAGCARASRHRKPSRRGSGKVRHSTLLDGTSAGRKWRCLSAYPPGRHPVPAQLVRLAPVPQAYRPHLPLPAASRSRPMTMTTQGRGDRDHSVPAQAARPGSPGQSTLWPLAAHHHTIAGRRRGSAR